MTTAKSNPQPSVQFSNLKEQYPIFPLPIFLLSGGVQRLRIFEQKYLSMVSNANDTDGFVLSLYKKKEDFSSSKWGVHVNIIDFTQGEDGILEIDVQAQQLVSLDGFFRQDNGLLNAKTQLLPHWSSGDGEPNLDNSQIQTLTLFLEQVFNDNMVLNQLYKIQHFNNSSWVSSRLLEVMPIPVDEKEKFVHHLGQSQLNQMLCDLCEKNST
ncbi:LON peptidase substrate-binding domain-containing protein [Vibrio sp. RC27]